MDLSYLRAEAKRLELELDDHDLSIILALVHRTSTRLLVLRPDDSMTLEPALRFGVPEPEREG